jgi:hypothetical protein
MSVPLVRRVRQQRELTRANDGDAQSALMLRARAGNPPRQHLAALGDKAAQQLDVLVVDVVDLVRAELADLAAPEKAAATTLSAGLVAGLAVFAAAARAALLRTTKRHDLGLHIGAIEHHVA